MKYFGTPIKKSHSYGKFRCTACGLATASNSGEEMFCPKCSEPMKHEADASVSKFEDLKVKALGKCEVCASDLVTSEKDASFCPQCGSPFKAEAQDDMPPPEDDDDDEAQMDNDDDLEATDVDNDDDDATNDLPKATAKAATKKVKAQDVAPEDDDDEASAPGEEGDLMEIQTDPDEIYEQACKKVAQLADELGEDTEALEENPGNEDLAKSCETKTATLSAAIKVKASIKKLIKAQADGDEDMMEEAQEELQEVDDDLSAMEDEMSEEPDTDDLPVPTVDNDVAAKAFFINPVTAETKITTADIVMALHDEDKEDPFWNVTIKGMPTARVALSGQARPEEIKDAFISEDYAENVAAAMEKLGPMEVLKSINATYYANQVEGSDLASRMKAQVVADMDAEYKQKLAGLKDELTHCIGIVLAGSNKNFFSDADHILKAALWQSLKEAGIDDVGNHIEAAFEEAGPQYFNWVVDKAVEFMDKPKDAVAEIAKAIGCANTMKVDDTKEEDDKEPTTSLADKLARGSFAVQAGVINVDRSSKDEIRKAIRLSKRP